MTEKLSKNKKVVTIGFLVAVVCLIVVLLVALIFRGKTSHTMTEDGYQIVMGTELSVPNGVRLKLEDDLIVVSDGSNIDRTPVYYKKGKNRMMLPTMYMVVEPYNNAAPRKIAPFTEVFKNNDKYMIKTGMRKAIIERCFLYDGEDVYVFIDNTKITFGDTTVDVGPMSFVSVSYQQGGSIYDYESGKCIDIPVGVSGVKAEVSKDHVVYLDTDRLEGKDYGLILHHKPEVLATYR